MAVCQTWESWQRKCLVQCSIHLLRNQNLLEEICWGLPTISEDGGLIPWSLALGPWLLVHGMAPAWSLAHGPCDSWSLALGLWLLFLGSWTLHGSWFLALHVWVYLALAWCAWLLVLGSCVHGSGMILACTSPAP